MGGSHGLASNSGDLRLVTVSTDSLKERLNYMYNTMRFRQQVGPNNGLFEYLWDLKEMALLEGRDEVQIPVSWLDELEHEFHVSETTHLSH